MTVVLILICEAWRLLGLGVYRFRTRDTTPTHIITELYDFLILLMVSACQCRVRCPYPCFIDFDMHVTLTCLMNQMTRKS